MKRIRDIIRADFITMNGAKNEMKSLAIICFVLITAGVVFASPMVGVYFPFVFSVFFVQIIFKNEMKYNCEKMYGVLPIERKDLVNARYLYCSILYFGGNLIFYLITLLSQKLQLFVKFSDGSEETDVLAMIVKLMDDRFTEYGLLTLIYTIAFCFSLKLMTVQLILYFKNGAKKTKDSLKMMKGKTHYTKEEKKQIFISTVFILACLFLFFGLLSGAISIGPAASVFFMLIGQLAGLADGFLLNAVLLIVAVMQMVYAYFRTLIVYEQREI